ncbi:MAG: hypothetical protein HZA46_02270 [Planctomycetales bacterium]|nr:hypothetical protein [Planctomycetales bacterium]
MRFCIPSLLLLSLVVCVTSVPAQQEKGKKKKDGTNQAAAAAFALLKDLDLTADQKEKLAALTKEYTPKLTELSEKVNGILTADQKKARQEAAKEAKDSGKKGKEAKASVDAAIKLTDEQKKQMAEVQPKLEALQKEVREKLIGLLTDEQKAKLPKTKVSKNAKAIM